jgi:hypothetical protein
MRLLELNVRLYKDISIRIFTLSFLWKIKHSATFLQLSKQLYEMVQQLPRSAQPKTIDKAPDMKMPWIYKAVVSRSGFKE